MSSSMVQMIDRASALLRGFPVDALDEQQKLALRFFDLMIGNARAVNRLTEAGFVLEAMAIQRLMIEHFANIIDLLRGRISPETMIKESEAENLKFAQCLQRDDAKHGSLTDENRQKLEAFLAEHASTKSPSLSVYNALDAANLGFMYIKYRDLSMRAAHSTILSAIAQPTVDVLGELSADVEELLELTISHVHEAVIIPTPAVA